MTIRIVVKGNKVYLYDSKRKVSKYYKYNADITLEEYEKLYLHNLENPVKIRVGSLISKKEKELIRTDNEAVSAELKKRVAVKKLDSLINKIDDFKIGKHRVVLQNAHEFNDIEVNYNLLNQVAKDRKNVIELMKKRSYLKPLYTAEIMLTGTEKSTKTRNIRFAMIKLFNTTPDEVKGLLAKATLLGVYLDYPKKKEEENWLNLVFGTDNVQRENNSGRIENIIINFTIAKGSKN